MGSIVTVTVPATSTLLCTIDDLKSELGGLDTDDNPRLVRKIRAASQRITDYLDRALAKQTVSESFPRSNGAAWLSLSHYPVIGAITSVTDGGTALTTDDYQCNPETGQLFRVRGGSPACWWDSGTIVVYEGGYVLPGDTGDQTLPASIQDAAVRLAVLSYKAPDRDAGLRSVTVPGVIEKEFAPAGVSSEDIEEVSEEILCTLDRYRRSFGL